MAACSTAWTVSEQPAHGDARLQQQLVVEGVPEPPGGERAGRELQGHRLDDLAGRALAALVGHDPLGHLHRAQEQIAPADARPVDDQRVVHAEDGDVGLGARPGRLVDGGRHHPRRPIVEIEPLHPELAALVEVQGPRKDRRQGPGLVDGADQPAVAVDDAVLGGRRPGSKPHPGSRRALTGVEGAAATQPGLVGQHQPPHALFEVVAPPGVVRWHQRQLVGRTGQVGAEHERVRRVHHRRLGRAGEQLARVGHPPLVELVLPRHQHRRRLLALATGPARLLPHRGDGAGEAVEDAGVEAADVDAQLQGVGGGHAAELATEQLGLDLPPLRRQVPAPVRPHERGQLGRHPAAGLGGHQLGAQAAAGEGDGPRPGRDEAAQQSGGLVVARRPGAGLLVDERAGSTARRSARPGATRRR